MPIKLGNKNISTIYKGTTPISAIYKGTTLLYQSASWELYSKVYFYNELVPTTINGKNVLNKAKIVKVSGNGVIENQLLPVNLWSTQTLNGLTLTNNGDGSYTLNGTTNAMTYFGGSCSFVLGHKYLLKGCPAGGSWSDKYMLDTGSGIGRDLGNGVIGTATYDGVKNVGFYVASGITFNNVKITPQLIDLTLREGTGNEPSALTDNRIQAILNRGYIPFNLGKYKESDIGEFKSEPYNLLSGIEVGNLIGTTGEETSGNDTFRTDFISVISGGLYTFENGTFTSPTIHELDVFEYDEYRHFIKKSAISYNPNSSANKQTSISIGANTKYIRMTFYSSGTNWNNTPLPTTLCFHLTGTRTGYAEHKSFTPITFKAQLGGAINSHNTMEITNSAYVFTRNQWKYNLGDYYWTRQYAYGRYEFYTTKLRGVAKNSTANVICSNYTTGSRTDLANKQMAFESDGTFIVRDDTYTTDSDFRTAVTGTYIYYELATPQVISIPKKHLGIVDLGSLTGYVSNDKYYISAEYLGISTASSNNNGYSCYCEDYIVDNGYNVYNKTTDKTMCLTSPFIGGNFIIWDSSFVGKTANEIKALLSGKYLFFETENEVADIENVIDIESGGTIRANWFRWNENQLVPNGNFASGTSGWYTANSGTLSASNNKLTFTKTISGALSIYRANSDYPSFVLNHTYFVSAYVKASSNCTLLFTCGNTNTINLTINANTRTLLYGFATPTANGFVYKILDSNSNLLPINSTIEIEDCQLIDLTLGELEDVTSINDPRIQEIIRLGYIPTNTTGTYKEVSPVVLPNIELSVKCK